MLTKKEQCFITDIRRLANTRLPYAIIEVEERDGIIDIVCYNEGNHTRQTYTKGDFECYSEERNFIGAIDCIQNFIKEEYVEVLHRSSYVNKVKKQPNKTILLCITMKFIQHE